MRRCILSTLLLVASTSALIGLQTQTLEAESCEDIKGKESWGGESHGDNSPSEDKFDEMIFEEDATTCEVAESIDKMQAKGEIKEHEWDEFEESFVYAATSEEVQECFEDRFDLPDDDGDKHLADYEIQKCATGSY